MLILMRLLGRRMLFAFAALLGASALIFIGTEILPGDVAASILANRQRLRRWPIYAPNWGYIGRRRSVILIGCLAYCKATWGNRSPTASRLAK